MKKLALVLVFIFVLCLLLACNSEIQETTTVETTQAITEITTTVETTQAITEITTTVETTQVITEIATTVAVTTEPPIPQVNNIFLSKSELVLGIGEEKVLIATISPSNADNHLTWSSSDPEVAEVDNQGKVTAKAAGSAVIKVEAFNGVLAVCNVEVQIKTGSVTGNVTYKYNDYVGNKPDVNSRVYLVSKTLESVNDNLFFLGVGLKLDGCYYTTVDGNGNYIFDNIPVGEYYLVIESSNTNENPNYISGYKSYGDLFYIMTEEAQERALRYIKYSKTRTASVKVLDGKTTNYSYDFGITYN